MRIVLFGTTSPFSLSCLQALFGAGHSILFVMNEIPVKSKLKRNLLRRWPAPERFARSNRIPIAWYRGAKASESAIAAFAPDIICIATFTKLIPASIAALAPLGAINLHPSLLPRHRGPQTLFCVYRDGDRETGLTVHRASARFDAGPMILQESLSIPRGHPVELLGDELMMRSGPMLVRAVSLVQAGAPEQVQDELAATRATRLDPTTFRAPIDRWDVDQSWHFLSGFCSRFKQPLADAAGKEIRYGSVAGFTRRRDVLPPGTVEPIDSGWLLHCNGGVIRLEP